MASTKVAPADSYDAAELSTAQQAEQWTVAAWLDSLDLIRTVVASVLVPPAGSNAFQYVRTELDDVLQKKLADAKLEGLLPAIRAGIGVLSKQRAATGAELASKFQADGETAFELQYAKLADFFSGLEGVQKRRASHAPFSHYLPS